MPIIFSGTVVQLVIAVIVLAIMTGAAIYVSSLLRVNSLQKKQSTDDLLDYFRELQSKGKLTDAEFRIIKKQIASQAVKSLKEGDISDDVDILRLLAREGTGLIPSGRICGDQAETEETRQWSGDSGDTTPGN